MTQGTTSRFLRLELMMEKQSWMGLEGRDERDDGAGCSNHTVEACPNTWSRVGKASILREVKAGAKALRPDI